METSAFSYFSPLQMKLCAKGQHFFVPVEGATGRSPLQQNEE